MARDNRDRRKGDKASDRRRVPKKKVSILTQERIDWVDYKDVNLLRRFMSERAKIRARRVTGNNQQQQRAVAQAIRIAREMALLPYSVRQVTQRSRGGGRGRDRDRSDLSAPLPTPDAPPPVASDVDGAAEAELVETVVGAEGTEGTQAATPPDAGAGTEQEAGE
jgi:small subunit ribosomal protein S18